MKEFTYSRTDYDLTVDGEEVHAIDDADYVSPLELVTTASLSSLEVVPGLVELEVAVPRLMPALR